MFEHLGVTTYRTYFECAQRLLRDDALLVLHTISEDTHAAFDPLIDRHIIPNGHLPTVGQIGMAMHGLFIVEENFGVYHTKTLMAWNDMFQGNGRPFCR